MGLQVAKTINGASVLVVDHKCDNDQLLVSLSKNDVKWLSPVGWTHQQKVTLLDCRSKGETTEIDIPSEFASEIKTGDVLVLRCSELDFEKEIIWEASEVETRMPTEASSATMGLTGGLLSRFKGSKTELSEEVKSEAEQRAEDADRAAQNFKAKMEAATAAKEQAQRKALQAAREAEAALKMEAERIAEMERAAKAFEEAERLKQDELRRVEEERRAEETRLAEEALRIELARKREISAKKEAERKAALERYEAALEISQNEQQRLKTRLKELKHQAKTDASNIAVQQEDLHSRQELLIATEETASKRLESYEKSVSKLNAINADLSVLESESETLTADLQAVSIRLSQADMDYQQAQKDAEAAMAKAESRRLELELIRQEEGEVSGKILAISEKLSSKSQMVSDTSETAQRVQSKLEATQAELVQAKIEIEALENVVLGQADKDQNLRLEIETTQQALEDSQAHETAHLDAIQHLEAGGDPEDITDIDFETGRYEALSLTSDNVEELAPKTPNDTGLKGRMMGRVRRNLARGKEASMSIEVDDVVLEPSKSNPVLLAGVDDRPSFLRRHSSSLMALGAVIGGIAILGGGLALNKSAKPKLEVKSSMPAPTQVASAVTKITVPKGPELKNLDVANEAIELDAKDAPRVTIDLPTIETAEAAPTKMESATTAEPKEATFIVKLAEVVDPTGFAFELPDMQPIASPKKNVKDPKPKKAATIKKRNLKKSQSKKAQTIKTAKIKTPKAKSAPMAQAEVNYPELTSDIQTRLFKLGFYNGNINGLQTNKTKEAITSFKTLSSMSDTSGKITGALLTELKRAEREQKATELAAQAEQSKRESQAFIQVADLTPAVTFYDTVKPVPSTPIVTDTMPTANAFSPSIAPRPADLIARTQTTRVASIPSTVREPAPAPAVQDVIVEAKVLKNASANYPSVAQRKNYFVNVEIQVGYDIDVSGRAANISIVSNDHTGRFNDSFEREAIKAIKKLRYKPKTINGTPASSTGLKKRIVFRAG